VPPIDQSIARDVEAAAAKDPRDARGNPDLQALAERRRELAAALARVQEQINVTNLATIPPVEEERLWGRPRAPRRTTTGAASRQLVPEGRHPRHLPRDPQPLLRSLQRQPPHLLHRRHHRQLVLIAQVTSAICLPVSQDGITYRAGRMVPVSTMKERHL
jgi:hypothetical protein